jgi:hypothetical protein
VSAPQEVYAVIEVHAGLGLGVSDPHYLRHWEVRGADAHLARLLWADRMTEALAYASQLPYPQQVRWWTVQTLWLEPRP